MSEVTVEEYAEILNISPNLLIEQLKGAGISCDQGLKWWEIMSFIVDVSAI